MYFLLEGLGKILKKILGCLPHFRQFKCSLGTSPNLNKQLSYYPITACNPVLVEYHHPKLRKDYSKLAFKCLMCIVLLSKTIESESSKRDIEENILHLMTLARIALEKGDIERAEAILEMGLKISEDHKVYLGIPYMYDILATIAFAQGNTQKAENLIVNVIEKMIKTGTPEDDHHIVDFKLRLSRIYSSYKDNGLAEIGFKTCLELQKSKIMRGDISTRTGMLYVNVLFWYGIHKIRNEDYMGAKKIINNAYDYSVRIRGLSPYQEMVILYTLADLNLELEQYDIALQNMLNAVMLGKGISSIDLPRCYLKLAKIYIKVGAINEAKSSAEEAEKLARMFYNTEAVEDAKLLLEEIKFIQK